MTRIIKFRGKRIDNGEWVYGFYMVGLNDLHYIIHKEKTSETAEQNFYTIVYPDSVGEYTTINSKENHEIFEKDVLTFGKSETKYEVLWRNDGWIAISTEGDKYGSFTHRIYLNTGYDKANRQIKIVGNTIDNPKLLKE